MASSIVLGTARRTAGTIAHCAHTHPRALPRYALVGALYRHHAQPNTAFRDRTKSTWPHPVATRRCTASPSTTTRCTAATTRKVCGRTSTFLIQWTPQPSSHSQKIHSCLLALFWRCRRRCRRPVRTSAHDLSSVGKTGQHGPSGCCSCAFSHCSRRAQ